jgi:WD40 repeat protein
MLAGARSQPVISENGRYLVLDTQAGADASALTLWDLNGLRALGRVVTGTPAEVVAIDPRGRYLAISDRERFVRVWQVQNQALTAECEHPARPIAVAFDPSGQWLVTQDVADALRIWDYSAGCRVLVARRGNGRWQAAFSPAADSVLVGNYSRGFEWLALPLGQRMGIAVQPGMSGAGSVPETVAAMPRLVPQLGLAVTYDGRRAVKLWTLPRQDGEASAVVAGDTDEIAISPGTGLVARGSAAGDVRMGAGDTLATLRQVADTEPDFIGHLSAVTALAFDHRGRLVASGSLDGTIRVWDARSGMPRNFFAAHGDGAVHDIAFFPRGEWLASASRGSVLVVDAASGEVRSRLAIQAEHPVLDVSADGAWVYIAGDRNGITRWNWRTGSANTVAEGEQPIRVIALSRDGQLLAGAANDRVVRLWQLHTGVVLHRTFTAPAPVNAVWFSADRSQLMVQSGAWVHVLDVDTAGLTARHSTPLPDADTRIGPAADGQGVLLFGTTPGALPGVTRLARSQSWASPVDVDRNSPLARTIAGRLNLTVDAMGAMRPADTPLNH